MSACSVCQHPQREAIDHDLYAQIDHAVLAVRYRVRKAFLAIHAAHMVPESRVLQAMAPWQARNDLNGDCSDVVACVEHEPETAQDALKLALPHVRQAVRLAGADQDEQQRIVAILNRALEDEQMGLP